MRLESTPWRRFQGPLALPVFLVDKKWQEQKTKIDACALPVHVRGFVMLFWSVCLEHLCFQKLLAKGPKQIWQTGRMSLTNSTFHAEDPSESQSVSRQILQEDRSGNTCKSAERTLSFLHQKAAPNSCFCVVSSQVLLFRAVYFSNLCCALRSWNQLVDFSVLSMSPRLTSLSWE
jgi:hypothetical protein